MNSLVSNPDKFAPPLAAHLNQATCNAADHDGFHFETDGIAVDVKYDDVNDKLAGGTITIVIDHFEYIIEPIAIFNTYPKNFSLQMTFTINFKIEKGKSIKVDIKADAAATGQGKHGFHITQALTFSAIKKEMWHLEFRNLPVSTYHMFKPFNVTMEFCSKCFRGQVASEELDINFNGTYTLGQRFEITVNRPFGLTFEIALDNNFNYSDGNTGTVSLSCLELPGHGPTGEGLLGSINSISGQSLKKIEITGTSGACFLPMDFVFEMFFHEFEHKKNKFGNLFSMSLSSNRMPHLNFKLEANQSYDAKNVTNLSYMHSHVKLSSPGQPDQELFSLEYRDYRDSRRKLSLKSGDLGESLLLRKLLGYGDTSHDKDRTVGLEFSYDEIDNYKYQIIYKNGIVKIGNCCNHEKVMTNPDFYDATDRIEQITIFTLSKKNTEQGAIVVSLDQTDLNHDKEEVHEVTTRRLTLDRCENNCVKGSFSSIYSEFGDMIFEGNQSPGEVLRGPLLEAGRRLFLLFWWVDKGRELYAQGKCFVQAELNEMNSKAELNERQPAVPDVPSSL